MFLIKAALVLLLHAHRNLISGKLGVTTYEGNEFLSITIRFSSHIQGSINLNGNSKLVSCNYNDETRWSSTRIVYSNELLSVFIVTRTYGFEPPLRLKMSRPTVPFLRRPSCRIMPMLCHLMTPKMLRINSKVNVGHQETYQRQLCLPLSIIYQFFLSQTVADIFNSFVNDGP